RKSWRAGLLPRPRTDVTFRMRSRALAAARKRGPPSRLEACRSCRTRAGRPAARKGIDLRLAVGGERSKSAARRGADPGGTMRTKSWTLLAAACGALLTVAARPAGAADITIAAKLGMVKPGKMAKLLAKSETGF